jgi:RNA polymerase-binding protein DksA
MDRKRLESFAAELRRRRDELWKEVADAEHDLSDLAENQDPEFEERAREETDARVLDQLDNRGKHEIEEIDAALLRIEDGSYGACVECGEKIAVERLRAVPETELCVDCAAQVESTRRHRSSIVRENNSSGSAASDEEKQILLYDRLREDGRIELDDLEFECRHGVLHLSGTLPDALQHQLLRELVLEIGCFGTTVDHIEIQRVIEAEDGQAPESEEE